MNFVYRGKRPTIATNGSGNVPPKKGHGASGLQNQLVNRALDVGEVGLEAEGEGGVDVEEEEATGSLGVCPE